MEKVSILSVLLSISALAVPFQMHIAQEGNPAGGRLQPAVAQEKQQMTPAEKVAGWKGQKVAILGTQPLSCPASPNSQLYFRKLSDDEGDFLPYDKYAGQTGVIVEATMGSYEPQVVVQLDKGGEKIVSKGNDGLAFQSELETAKGLIGRSLWSRGSQKIELKDSMCQEITKRETYELKNLQAVTVEAVEIGHHLQPIYLLLKTQDGQHGLLTGWDGYTHFDSRFRADEKNQIGVPNLYYTDRFYTKDPRKLHPGWKDPIWKLIENGEVAIGMTEEMAKMACGQHITAVGLVLAEGEVSPIYVCKDKKFLIQKGKVTKYVN